MISGATRRRPPASPDWSAICCGASATPWTGKRQSIGVVAFSDAQQEEIDRALDRLGRTDGDFDRLLAAERERVDGGEFTGLFVKNLENVQGDERDIIILSVCYARGAGRQDEDELRSDQPSGRGEASQCDSIPGAASHDGRDIDRGICDHE